MLLAIIALNLDNWLYLKGVYVGVSTDIEEFTTGYVMDVEHDLEVIGESQMLVFGRIDGRDYSGSEGSFRGVIDVQGYSIPASLADGNFTINDGRGYPVKDDGGYLRIEYTVEGNLAEGVKSGGYEYTLILNPNDAERLIIVIRGEEGTVVAVNAGTAEQARQIYRDYLERQNAG